MSSPSLNEITRQAAFFFKEKIKIVRLALTDVTPVQLLAEEATNGDLSTPDARTLGLISRAAFEVDDYWRIVDILHKRLSCFDKKYWRASYKTLIVLEHLLTHGPKRVAEEFQNVKDILREMTNFQYVDERGFNWGSSVGSKSENILNMLDDKVFLEEERTRTRKLTCGIKGFGSFTNRSSSVNGSLKDLAKCNSLFRKDQKNDVLAHKDEIYGKREPYEHKTYSPKIYSPGKTDVCSKARSRTGEEFIMESSHPFCDDERQTGSSLLASSE